MIQEFEVVNEDGIFFEGAELAQGEIISVDTELMDVSELISDGSIIPYVENNDLEDEPNLPGEDDATEEVAQGPMPGDVLFNGRVIVGEVVDVLIEGMPYKAFSTDSGESFKVPEGEYVEGTVTVE